MRFNPVLEKLKPYKAGPSLAEIRQQYHQEQITKMSANEVPWGPFPEVVRELTAALGNLNRYPDGACSDLKTAISAMSNVRTDQLCFGNGSCELLMILGQALLGPGRRSVFLHPSYVLYKAIALMNNAPFTAVPLKGMEPDLDAMADAITDDTSLVSICNPNNPTGGYVEPVALRAFLERVPSDVVVVLDEAYIEFVTSPAREDTARWVAEFPNLVVLRTFSKIYGLAGLRIGYAIADNQVIQALDKLRQPFNVDSLAQTAALESLRHPDRVIERRDIVAREKSRVAALLDELGIGYHLGEANFLLVDVTGFNISGPEVGQELLNRGVLTRSGYGMECPGWIRVSIGSDSENDLFVGAIREVNSLKVDGGVQVEDAAIDAVSVSPES